MLLPCKKLGGVPTKLPPHPQPVLNWTVNANSRLGRNQGDGFTFVFPTPKYYPPAFQPGPGNIYLGGEAAAIGNQPYNYTQVFSSASTPRNIDFLHLQMYASKNSPAQTLIAQQTMSTLLSLRKGYGSS